MNIWAIADLHLSFGVPSKTMEVFGEEWTQYSQRIKDFWLSNISPSDLVLIAGDISWAKNLKEALVDFSWIDNLPGTKVFIKGNHDYWWSSKSKLIAALPQSCHFIQNDVFNWNGISIGGTRLWESSEFNFDGYVNYEKNPTKNTETEVVENVVDNEKIFQREKERLILSLSQLDKNAKYKIAMTHYPPISADLKDSQISKILEEYKIDLCVFGHLHHVRKDKKLFGEKNGIKYVLSSSDFLNFKALKVY